MQPKRHEQATEPLTKTQPVRSWTRFLNGSPYLLLLVLITVAACAARRDYNEAVLQDTVEAYGEFLHKHPDKKKYSTPAEVRLEMLSFNEATRQDTFPAYIDFLKKFPSGKFSQLADKRAEEIRAKALDIHLYRSLPADYYDQVSTRELPYRILVRSSDTRGEISDHLERKWYDELVRRDLFLPMDPRKTYPVRPDLTLYLRESVIRLCRSPLTLVEADVWVGDQKVKSYRIAGDRIDQYLLYEIFRDRGIYDALFRIPDNEKKVVADRFERFRKEMPRPGSLAFEFEVRQDASAWDEEATLAFVGFLKEQPLYDDFTVYPRGQPPDHPYLQRIYYRTDPEIHAPYVREKWSTAGPLKHWNRWNSKWILQERDYFFKMMTLDLLDLLDAHPPNPPQKRKP